MQELRDKGMSDNEIKLFKAKEEEEQKRKLSPPKLRVVKREPEIVYSERVQFYKGTLRLKQCGNLNIDEMIERWSQNHKILDTDKNYMSWFFPGFKDRQGPQDTQYFRTTFEIGERIVEIYKLMMNYYGINVLNPQTGRISRSKSYSQRYEETFLSSAFQSVHIQKIRKILQFLNAVGFRKYAIELVKFMKKEIFGEGGQETIMVGKKKIVKLPPLCDLEQYFDTEWKPFGEIYDKQAQMILLKEHCLLDKDNIHKNSEYFADSL